jgi:hypothetical protein
MYLQREPLGGVGDNRVWSILTVEHLAGAAVGGGFGYGASRILGLGSGESFGPGFWIQLVLIAVGMGCGALLMIRVRGLSLMDRLICGVGFLIGRMSGQHRVVPPLESSVWATLDLPDEDLLALVAFDDAEEVSPHGTA